MNSIQVNSTKTPSLETTKSIQNTKIKQTTNELKTQIKNPIKFSTPVIHPKKEGNPKIKITQYQ